MLFSARNCRRELQMSELRCTYINDRAKDLLMFPWCKPSTACSCHLTAAKVPTHHKLKVDNLDPG